MTTFKRSVCALMLAATVMTGCGKAPSPAANPAPTPTEQQPTETSAIDKEFKTPLTETPSKPMTLKWPSPPAASDADLSNAVVNAQQLLNTRKADEALKVLQPLAGAKNRELQIVLGIAAYNAKDLDGAAEAYLRAIDVDPKSAVAHNNLANVYRDQNKYDLAVPEYQKAIEIDPHYEFAITNLHGLLNALHRPLWSKRVLLLGIAANPKSANLQAQLGDLMASQKNYKEARDAYEAALKLDPKHNQATTGLSNLPK